MWAGGEQLAGEWTRRHEIAIEHEDAQVKLLRFKISGMKASGFCGEMHGVLIMNLVDVDSDQGGGQRHRRRIPLETLGQYIFCLVEHSSLAVGKAKTQRQGHIARSLSQQFNGGKIVALCHQ